MPARGPKIAEAYVEVHADMDSIPGEIRRGVDGQQGMFRDSGSKAGGSFGDGFNDTATTRISGAKGRYAASGDVVGRDITEAAKRSVSRGGPGIAHGLVSGVEGGVRSAAPRMVAAGGGMVRGLAGGIRGHSALVGGAVAAGFAGAPAIGALASAGIVGAFGAGLAGIGMFSIAELEKVKGHWVIGNKEIAKAFHNMSVHVGKIMRNISEPFKKTWLTIANVVTRTMDRIAPHLEQMFSGIAPSLSRFIDNLGLAFERLMPGLSQVSGAFVIFLDTLGPALPGIFTSISDGLGAVADAVSRNPEAIVGLISGLFQLLEIGLRFIAWLTDVWGWLTRHKDLFITIATMAVPMLIGAFSLLSGGTQALGTAFSSVGAVFSSIGSLIAHVATTIVTSIGQRWSQLWNLTVSIWNSVYNWISSRLSAAWTAVVNLGARIVQSISAAWNGAVQWTANAWQQMVTTTATMAGNVLAQVRTIPGRILAALGNLGQLLVNAGRNVISGLISGISSMMPSLSGIMSNVAGAIRRFLPFSPAKEGPLSGSGAPEVSGERIAGNLAGGIMRGRASVTDAMGALLGPITPPAVAATAGGGGGGGRTLSIGHLSVNVDANIDLSNPSAARKFGLEIREILRRLEADYA